LAVLRVFMTKEYTAQDYRLVFLWSVQFCFCNVEWLIQKHYINTTLGSILDSPVLRNISWMVTIPLWTIVRRKARDVDTDLSRTLYISTGNENGNDYTWVSESRVASLRGNIGVTTKVLRTFMRVWTTLARPRHLRTWWRRQLALWTMLPSIQNEREMQIGRLINRWWD
jgi:hypothetical protein